MYHRQVKMIRGEFCIGCMERVGGPLISIAREKRWIGHSGRRYHLTEGDRCWRQCWGLSQKRRGVGKRRMEPQGRLGQGDARTYLQSPVPGPFQPSLLSTSPAFPLSHPRIRGILPSSPLFPSPGTWRPRRSIVFASWGAEEFGLIGSTEFTEVSEPRSSPLEGVSGAGQRGADGVPPTCRSPSASCRSAP